MAIGEFELIERYFRQEAGALGVAMGIGDDCALLNVPEGQQLAVSMDTLVGGIHFPKNADPELIAERALRVNLSDLAAMGSEPMAATGALTLKELSEPWLQDFSSALAECIQESAITDIIGDKHR